MNNVLNIVENEQTSEFYPTPPSLVEKMLSGIDWKYVHTILEPSAGKGDILREIAKQEDKYYNSGQFDVDCIEIDPNLRQILKYNFSSERKAQFDRWKDAEYKTFFGKGIHIVHDNFLTYRPYKQYDLIIMNPPFSNGEKHLLKALQMQEKGGNIVCLLNAETIRNPYTHSRQTLIEQLNKYGAEIEYIDNAFVSAERRTGVEVALIKVAIERVQEESDIYEKMRAAENVDDIFEESTDLEVSDYITAMIAHFNVEVNAGLELIRQYRALRPYMLCTFDKTAYGANNSILRLVDDKENSYSSSEVTVNDYLKCTRRKYWQALFSNPKFTEKLTSKLQKEWREKVEKLTDYDFTEFNIKTVTVEMNAQVKQGVEDEIIAMFDRLTYVHSYYPEFSNNRHYYNGWKTNQAHKIGKKVIIPCRGVFSDLSDSLYGYKARETLEDIERILNFLDGHMTMELDSWRMIDNAFSQKITKNIICKYFKVTFYKKGTAHLTFTCPELIERFNIYAAQQKQWLPPSYGKKTYKDMSSEEKAVVDSFQGEKAYAEIMRKSNYYFAPVTNQIMMLEG